MDKSTSALGSSEYYLYTQKEKISLCQKQVWNKSIVIKVTFGKKLLLSFLHTAQHYQKSAFRRLEALIL